MHTLDVKFTSTFNQLTVYALMQTTTSTRLLYVKFHSYPFLLPNSTENTLVIDHQNGN